LVAQSAVGQVPSIPQNPKPGSTTNPPPKNQVVPPNDIDVFRQIAEGDLNTPGTQPPGITDIEIIGNETLRSGQIERDINETNQHLVNERGHSTGDLRLNARNGYQRPGDTGTYYWTPGFIYYTGGTVTLQNGTTRNYGPSVRNTLTTGNGRRGWTDSPNPPPFALALANLNLIPTADGNNTVFYRPGSGNQGNYYLAPNGQIFFEGGTINGQSAGPQTYVNGVWGADLNTRPPGTQAIHRLGLIPLANGRWLHNQSGAQFTQEQLIQIENLGLTLNQHGCFSMPNDSRYYFTREDGTIWTPGGGTLERILVGRRFENGRWIEDTSPSGSAHQIAYANSHNQRLIPRPDGTFYDPDNADSIYIPQADGSWFMCQYDLTNPSSRTNSDWGPITLTRSQGSNTGWAWGGSSYPLSARHFMQVYGIREREDRTLTSPIYNGTFYRLPNDRLLFIRSSDNSNWIFSNGRWERSQTPIQPPNPPITSNP
jgi:hypothetical protein